MSQRQELAPSASANKWEAASNTSGKQCLVKLKRCRREKKSKMPTTPESLQLPWKLLRNFPRNSCAMPRSKSISLYGVHLAPHQAYTMLIILGRKDCERSSRWINRRTNEPGNEKSFLWKVSGRESRLVLMSRFNSKSQGRSDYQD